MASLWSSAGVLLLLVASAVADVASEVRTQTCKALKVAQQECVTRVQWFGVPAQGGGELRILRRSIVQDGEQIELRATTGNALPFLVLLQGGSIQREAGSRGRNHQETFVVRMGDAAELIQEAEGIRIVRRVHCLQNGYAGDRIWVREEGDRTKMRAMVIKSGILQADL